jgi:prepilin peptidase CpaA
MMIPTVIEMSTAMTGAVMAVAALAVREDVVRHRIPNRLNLAALLLGCSLAFLAGGSRGLVLHAAGGALVGCGVFVPFYLLRGMGAGDAKLMGALGSFLGPGGALLAAAWALVAGAVIALAIVAWRLVEPRPRLEHTSAGASSVVWRAMDRLSTVRNERFPYAVAIAAGVLMTLWLQGSLRTLYSALGIG